MPTAVQWLLKHKTGTIATDYQVQRARAEKEKADHLELKNAQMRGELVDAKEIEAHYTDLVVNFRTRLRALPAKLVPQLPLRKTPAEVQTAMLRGIDYALRELAG